MPRFAGTPVDEEELDQTPRPRFAGVPVEPEPADFSAVRGSATTKGADLDGRLAGMQQRHSQAFARGAERLVTGPLATVGDLVEATVQAPTRRVFDAIRGVDPTVAVPEIGDPLAAQRASAYAAERGAAIEAQAQAALADIGGRPDLATAVTDPLRFIDYHGGNIAESLPAMGVALATGGAAGPLAGQAMMGATTGMSQYEDATRAGLDGADAAREAVLSGLVEVAGEVGLPGLLTPGRRLAGVGLEALGEAGTELGQSQVRDQSRGTETPLLKQFEQAIDAAIAGAGAATPGAAAGIAADLSAPPPSGPTELQMSESMQRERDLRAVTDPADPTAVEPAAPRAPVDLEPRAPAPAAVPEGATREQLVAAIQAAPTPEARAYAAGVLAAYDASVASAATPTEESQRGQAEAEEGTGEEDGQGAVGQGRPGDAGQAQAVREGQALDPTAPGAADLGRPAAPELEDATQVPNTGLPQGLPAAPSEASARVDASLSRWLGEEVAGTQEVAMRDIAGVDEGAGGLAQVFQDVFGLETRVLRFTPDSPAQRLNGFTRIPGAPNVAFVNESSGDPFLTVVAHEFGHDLRKQAPDLYDGLVAALRDNAQLSRYMAESLGPRLTAEERGSISQDLVREEMISDTWQRLLTDRQFVQDLAAAEPTLFTKLRDRVVEWIDNVLARLRDTGHDATRYYRDLEAMRAAFRDTAVQYAKRQAPPRQPAPAQPDQDPTALRADPYEDNGSGDSSASIEAINRQRDERDAGQTRMLIDRDDTVRELRGVDAVDTHARAGQIIVQRGVGRDEWTILSQGDDVSPTVAQGRINRARAQLDAPAEEPRFSRAPPTDSPEFKRWFGDSKVVDADGRPLVVYHGTGVAFTEFFGSRGVPGYFTDDPAVASAYADQADGWDEEGNPVEAAPNVMPVYLSIQNPLVLDAAWQADNMAMENGDWDWEVLDTAISDADQAGYDGAILRGFIDFSGLIDGVRTERAYDQFVPFRRGQIKSATGNAGTFDPTNPSIVASRRAPALRNLTREERARIADRTAETIVRKITQLPSAQEMAAIAVAGQAKRGWYARSASALSAVFGPDAPRFAALLAALSPQTSVESNLRNALHTWKNWVAAGRPSDEQDIIDVLARSVEGGRGVGSVLPAWIGNSVLALGSETAPESLSGPKVSSFMRNLLGDVHEVTNDAWMAAYANVDASLFKGTGKTAKRPQSGKSPGYLAMAAQTRAAATYLTRKTGETWTPAEVQETIWSWSKTLTELANSAGETRSAVELVRDQAVTDELIASTPDFGTLFTDPEYASILEEAGYGQEVQDLAEPPVGDAAGEAGQESGARRQASPFAPADQRRHEVRAAGRLDRSRDPDRFAPPVRTQTKAAKRAEDDAALAMQDEDYIPFSRRNPPIEVYGQSEGVDLEGLVTPVNIPGRGRVAFHGFAPAQEIARRYAEKHGNILPRTYAQVDPDRAARIAQAYDDAQHQPQDPETKRAYAAMIDETLAQYRDILATGLEVEFITGDDPYAATPRLAILDVVENNHLWVFPTTDGFGSSELDVSDNPLLAETEFEISGRRALANDIFRVVHDYFGHIANGVGFRADGEENAWREHSTMYSPLARRAMTSETRGQNSWVNFGPHGEANRTASSADTVYADQKTTLLPEWVAQDGAADEAPRASRRVSPSTAGFAEWFAGSKVTTRNGAPLVVYHGSPFDFDRFMADGTGAIWFAENAETTRDYSEGKSYLATSAGPTTYPVYLSVKNPLRLRFDMNGDAEPAIRAAERIGMDVEWLPGGSDFAWEIVNSAEFMEAAKREGYDGVRVRERGEWTWAVFEPTQVKSATANSGAFDPDNPSIVASRRGFSAKPRQPDAVSVDAYHYSPIDDLEELDPTFAGTAAAGRERRRFGMGRFGTRGGTYARLGFYVREPGSPVPSPEDVVAGAGASTLYHVQLDNIYDTDADPRGIVAEANGNPDLMEEEISDAGFDGYMTGPMAGIDTPVAVVFDIPGTIPVDRVEEPVMASRRAPTFYSALERSVTAGKGAPKRAAADAWKQWLDGAQRRGEFRQTERDWLDVDGFLDRNGTTTREQLAEFVRANQVEVQDVVLSDAEREPEMVGIDDDGEAIYDSGAPLGTKFASYQLPGGQNYRELLLTLPVSGPERRLDTLSDIAGTDIIQRPEYRSSHFDQPNILAHVRFNERTDADGKRVLFLEEIQSDWHQAGRKRGYKGEGRAITDAEFQEFQRLGRLTEATPEQDARYDELRALNENRASNAVPDAPFKATDEWAMLAFKRMVRHAAENGFDRIAWTTGEQQAERYDLSKQVERIGYTKRPNGTYNLSVESPGRGDPVFAEDGISLDRIEEVVGKEMAAKIANEEGRVYDRHNGNVTAELTGLDLKIGGEGMRGFYDNILPKAVNKWAKRFGGRVGQAAVNAGPRQLFIDGIEGEFIVRDSLTMEGVAPPFATMREAEAYHSKHALKGAAAPRVHALDLTPAMRETALEGLPLFSRKTPADARRERAQLFGRLAANGYQMGSPTQTATGGKFQPLKEAVDATRIKMQDKLLRVRRIQEEAGFGNAPGMTGIGLDDAMNAYRLETLMHGRTKDRLEAADRDFILKLQHQMRRTGVTLAQLEDYLLARHAPERNAAVAAINKAMPDAGSGLTTADANAIVAGTAPGPYSGKPLDADTRAAIQAMLPLVDGMRERAIDTMVEAGQITPALAATLRAKYKHYVPMRGKAGDVDGGTSSGTGRGLSGTGARIKRALGRGKDNLPQNILGELAGDLQRSIVAAEKARVARALLRFMLANPNDDLYVVEPVDLEWKFSEATGEAYLGVRNTAEDVDTTMVVMHDGKPVRIRFMDEQLAAAALNLNANDMTALVKYLGAINRWRSAVLTRFNPGFTPINVLRDLMFGLTAIASERGAGATIKAINNYVPVLYALHEDSLNPTGDASVPDAQKSTADWVREYIESGGKTGIARVDDVVDLQRRMSVGASTVMQLAAEGKPWSAARESVTRALAPIAEAVERVNDATENALRASAYISMRRSGSSRDQAAEYAKNLTINFNRKGEWGPALNAIYLFYNAAIQGTHAVVRVMRNPKAQLFVGGLAALQAVLAMSMMDDDEDQDGITAWDMVPDYVKRTSMVIPLGALTGNKADYFALPMPYGFNVFTYSGGRLGQWFTHGKRETDTSFSLDVLKSLTEAFSPIPLTDGYGSLFGDQVGFAMQLAKNEDDFGRRIAAEDPYAPFESPKALSGRTTTARPYHVLSQLLAKLGGADLEKLEPPVGYLDIAPEQLEAVVDYFGGGLGHLFSKGLRWWEQASAGNLETSTQVIGATPIAGRLLGTGNAGYAISDRYYAERGELERAKAVLQNAIQKGEDPEKALAAAQAEEPALTGLQLVRYKASRKGKYKKGDIRRTSTGGVMFEGAPGSPPDALRQAQKVNQAVGVAIRGMRDPELTNAQAVQVLGEFNLEGREDALEVLGLPKGYNADAVAPNRVRQRAIKALQDHRAARQQWLLRALQQARTEAAASATKAAEMERQYGPNWEQELRRQQDELLEETRRIMESSEGYSK